MKKTLRTKSSNINIIGFAVIIGLFVFSLSGCPQVNNMVNGNTATNGNTAANNNATANTNAGSNTTANSNANANTSALPTDSPANTNKQASNTAANTAAATKEEVPLTEEAKVFKNDLVGKWTDGNETVTITENKIETTVAPGKTHTYRVVNEKTVEATQDSNGTPWKATMKIENNGNTLLWYNESQRKDFKYTRVK